MTSMSLRVPLRGMLLRSAPLLWASAPVLSGCSAEPEPPGAAALRRLFPDQTAAVLAASEAFVPDAEGFRLGAAEARWRASQLHVVLPRDGGEPVRFRTPAGREVRVQEDGALGEGTAVDRSVAYPRAGGTSFWTATDGGVEEWLLLDAGVARGEAVVAAWHVEGATLRARGAAIELMDEQSGLPVLRVTAPRAYAASGRPVAATLTARGARIELAVDAGGEAVLVDPAWEPASVMHRARAQHTATRLESGEVLVVGGLEGDSPELYDPTADAWTLTSAMTSTRERHTATWLPSGKVLVAGGLSDEQAPLDGAELYDPQAGTWTVTSPMAHARSAHAAALLPDGRVLVAGGADDQIFTGIGSAELYDPQAGTWTVTRPMVGPRVYHTATPLPGGKVLVAGGFDGRRHLDSAELYDPEADRWTAARPMTQARRDHTATLLPSGKVLVAGGFSGIAYLDGAEVYDPEKDTWTPAAAPMSRARSGHTATLLPSDLVLFTGGYDGVTYLASAEVYDPEADTWTLTAPLKHARTQHTATLLLNGEVLLAGGQFALHDIATTERFGSALGDVCTAAVGCPPSGFCVDGTCCDAPCPCGACSAAGHCGPEGTSAKVGRICAPPACITDTQLLSPAQCTLESAACPEAAVVDCIAYRCDPERGACKASCASLDDCARGFVCNLQGHCVSPPSTPSASSGCGAAPGRPAPAAACAVGVALLALGAARRRRSVAAALLAFAAFAGASAARAQPAAPQASAAPLSAPSAPAAAPPAAAPPAAAPPAAAPPAAAPPAAAPPAAAPPDVSAEPPPAEDPIAGARAHFERGVALYRQGAWEAALAEFLASRELYPTWSATSSAALCLQQLRRYDEALALFETLLGDFSEKLPQNTRTAAQEAVVRLRGLIGTLDIAGAEIGASITVDGRRRGDYPMPAPLRVGAGSHVVRVYKEGFEPFEMRVDVAGGQVVRILSRLHKLVESGRLRVTEQKGKVLDVLVDGYTVGKTPWEGPLSPGQHTVALRGPGELGTMPASVRIQRMQTTPLALRAEELTASLRIEPTPVCASVTVDGVTLGNGIWEGRLSPGRHRIEVAAGGFVTAHHDVILARNRRAVVPVVLERVVLGSPLGRYLVELTAAPVFVPSLGGGAAGQCGAACSLALGAGGLGVVHAGYELWSGLGFGVTTGYLQVQQAVTARSTSLQIQDPLPESTGTADDALALRGFLAGGWAGLSLGDRLRLSMRLGAGALFAAVSDERSGTFTSSSSVQFHVDRTTAQGSASFFFMTPEVRAGLRLDDHLDVTVGLAAAVLIRLTTPVWTNAPGGVYGRIDDNRGYFGAFEEDPLVGEVTVALAPGVGARYTF
ncbi:uncharacterized protein SOCE26_064840 [Sorangium cellulosum]|uniref:PEGA domain-containing protein n=1 Tax=Sorangium cellulosum TaxID=56 RepID=A0A2L0F0D1_SORCE|nr:kelch repeat-containing protein [Sorangium cellulosum]AUX45005.1 uncharacterized protein SOCE26_064840 [Sorangium cellulosum]